MTITYSIESGEEKHTWETCECGNYAEMHPICVGVDDSRDRFPEDSGPYYSRNIFKVLACPACHAILAVHYTASCNEFEEERYSGNAPVSAEYSRKVLYYSGRYALKHYAIPRLITEVLMQAESISYLSPRASLILCRAVLEEICNNHEIPTLRKTKKGDNTVIFLKDRLRILFQDETLEEYLKPEIPPNLPLIEPEIIEMIKGLQLLGNEFTHGSQAIFTDTVSQDDANAVIELVNYVLQRLYVDDARKSEAKDRLLRLKKKFVEKSNEPNSSDLPF